MAMFVFSNIIFVIYQKEFDTLLLGTVCALVRRWLLFVFSNIIFVICHKEFDTLLLGTVCALVQRCLYAQLSSLSSVIRNLTPPLLVTLCALVKRWLLFVSSNVVFVICHKEFDSTSFWNRVCASQKMAAVCNFKCCLVICHKELTLPLFGTGCALVKNGCCL